MGTVKPVLEGSITRRGQFISSCGTLKLAARFGRTWRPSLGPVRTRVDLDFDGMPYSGVAVGQHVKLHAREALAAARIEREQRLDLMRKRAELRRKGISGLDAYLPKAHSANLRA